jgi:5'-deoxynucleotidase YfbR-like HD superfamily hydrolase
MLVADILVDAGLGHLELPGLLHDMHETLSGFGDVLHPVKVMNPEVYKFIDTVERSIDVAIGQRFDVDHNLFRDPCVQLADQRALATEKRDIITKCARNWRELPPPVDYNIMPMHEDYVIHTFTDRLKSLLKTHVS